MYRDVPRCTVLFTRWHVTPGQNAPLWSRSAFNFRESFCLFLTAQRHLHAKPAFALIELNILCNWESKRPDNDLRKSDFGQKCQPHPLKQTCHDKHSAYYYDQHNHNRFFVRHNYPTLWVQTEKRSKHDAWKKHTKWKDTYINAITVLSLTTGQSHFQSRTVVAAETVKT